ncbi:DUF1127 domain-containing protein [Stappia sp. BW2]|jgi:uncharacterized protein YjiS (DUF1127 family)|uniref:DUF1127 domain-containing protein n=1 Tax=Stappia sp. BW2 TaxID=2592622 RepID=UPI0011DEACCE|nr:DUF1127 domain-containing protein [Stappia sp. BW2]TYC67754.1 DUF1127 domain-containing protein [Stappia sp. BW2]
MSHTASTPFFAPFGQMVARAWRVFSNRRQFAKLTDWSDEQLKDIGLTRSDVRRALALPFYTDPTSLVNESSALRETVGYSAANSAQDKPVMTLVSESKTRQIAA